MEHQLDEFRTIENRGLKRRPKEYFAENFWVTFWFETFAPKHMLEEIGSPTGRREPPALVASWEAMSATNF
jgi:hypothetical protein